MAITQKSIGDLQSIQQRREIRQSRMANAAGSSLPSTSPARSTNTMTAPRAPSSGNIVTSRSISGVAQSTDAPQFDPGPLNLPPTKMTQKAVVTSGPAKDRIATVRKELQEGSKKFLQPAKPIIGDAYSKTVKVEGPKAPAEPQTDAFGVTEDQYAAANASIDQEFAQINSAFDRMAAVRDAQTEAQIKGIQALYAQRRQEQTRLNTEILATQRQSGLRSGRSRYAPEIQSGMMNKIEQVNLQKIADLNAEEENLLAQAQSSASAQNFGAMMQQYELAREVRMDKQKTINDLRDAAVKQNSIILQKAQQAREDQRFDRETQEYERKVLGENAGYLAGSLLTTDEGGDLVMPSRAELTQLAAQSGIPASQLISTFNSKALELQKMSSSERLQELQILQAQKNLMDEKITGKVGEYQDALRLGLIDSTTSFQDFNDMEVGAATRVKAQYDSQGNVTSLGEGVDKALNLAFSNIKFPTVADKKDAQNTVKQLIADGDTEAAKETLKSWVFNSASAAQQDVLAGKQDALASLDRIESAIKAYEEAGGNTGFITGLSEAALNKVGRTRDTQLNKMKSDIALSIIDYRKAVSGAAFTESEKKAYDEVFPSIGNAKDLNTAKVETLRNKFQSDVENFTKRRIGEKNYEEIFGGDDLGQSADGQDDFASLIQSVDDDTFTWIEAISQRLKNQGYDERQTKDYILEELGKNKVGGDTETASSGQGKGFFASLIPSAKAAPIEERDNVQVYESPQGKPVSSPTTLLNKLQVITKAVAPNLQKFASNCVFFARQLVPNIPTGATTVAGRIEGLKKAEKEGYGGTNMEAVQPGFAIHTSEGDVGHTAYVKERVGNKLILLEANYKTGQVTEGRAIDINDPKILGWIAPQGKAPKRIITNTNEGRNKAIEKQISQVMKKSRLKLIS